MTTMTDTTRRQAPRSVLSKHEAKRCRLFARLSKIGFTPVLLLLLASMAMACSDDAKQSLSDTAKSIIKEKKKSAGKSEAKAPVPISVYTPPPQSPLARKVHPRLYLTPEELPALRQRLKTLYREEFQKYVNELDRHFDDLPESKIGGILYLDTKNYAFLYLIDPATLPEFSFGHSREQYGRKAIEHAMFIKRETRHDRQSSAGLQGDNGGYLNLSLAVSYDWLHALLTLEEKRTLADAMIRLYDTRDDEADPGNYVKLSNQVTGYIHSGCAGALALWGDDLGPGYSDKAQEMLNFFNAVFLERSLAVGDKVFEGPGWGEGASYYMMGITNVSFMAGAASTALGENLFFKHPFLRYNVLYLLYNILPLKLKDNYYLSRHDTNSLQKVIGSSTGRICAISAGALQHEDPRIAGLAKWMMSESGFGQKMEDWKYFDPRIDYLFFKFIWGSAEVTPLTPEQAGMPLTYKLALGEIVMKSSFDKESSTHIIFWAPKYWYAPHAHKDIASFTIFKHGSLALDAGSPKNANDFPRSSSAREAVFHNILGLYDPDEPEDADDRNFMNFSFSARSEADHWQDEEYQPNGRNYIGEIKALESNADYDFVDYDYSAAYRGGDKSKASSAHRRFAYLRGPENQEFVLIHDLVESPFEKRFLLHTAFEPAIADDQITVTNNFEVAHGRMIVKSLLPAQKEILKIGGEAMWFVDADGKPVKSRGPYVDWGAYWTGSYRAEIRSKDGEFLTVMQIGDSRTLQAMAPVTKIASAVCSGALINGQRLVMFSKNTTPQRSLNYKISAQGLVSHLVTGLTPNKMMQLRKNGNVFLNVKTSEQGVMYFKDDPQGSATYEVTE
ncbi:hypothetical protein KJ068_25780 [bacterium]|nr:hypothetical protein [bacterium]